MSVRQFIDLYGIEEKCEAVLEASRWPQGFRSLRCGQKEHGLVYRGLQKRYKCRQCRHQTILTTGTLMEATKLPLRIWFLASYLIGQGRTVLLPWLRLHGDN